MLPITSARRVLPAFLAAVALVAPGATASAQTNLLYNDITPCRLVDTRIMGGPLMPGVARTFNAVGVGSPGSLASQGGNPNGCPIPGFSSSNFPQVFAIAANLVAVGPTGPGDLVAWQTGLSQPNAAVINYSNVAGLNIANMVILPVRNDIQGADITIKAQNAGTHLVIDVVGYFSDATPTPGDANLFLGRATGSVIATGTSNSAFGDFALLSLSSGNANSALGASALFKNTSGASNVAVGAAALFNNTGGSSNIAIGASAGGSIVAGSNNIEIGNPAPADESGTIRIGTVGTHTTTFIAGINGVTSAGGTAVFIDSNGHLGTTTSSLRFKEEVTEMGEASTELMQLRPVTFRYKPAYDDGSHLLQYGLVAEDVAQVDPGLVQIDAEGRPIAVRYHFVNAMLLNEVQKQHRVLAAQQDRVAALEAQLAEQRQLAERQEARLARLESLLARTSGAVPGRDVLPWCAP